jgi:hypothetical protein
VPPVESGRDVPPRLRRNNTKLHPVTKRKRLSGYENLAWQVETTHQDLRIELLEKLMMAFEDFDPLQETHGPCEEKKTAFWLRITVPFDFLSKIKKQRRQKMGAMDKPKSRYDHEWEQWCKKAAEERRKQEVIVTVIFLAAVSVILTGLVFLMRFLSE